MTTSALRDIGYGVVGAFAVWAIYFIRDVVVTIYTHQRKATFDTAISNASVAKDEFVKSLLTFKNNINLLDLEYIKVVKTTKLDNEITFPLFDLTNKTIRLQMFLDQNKRSVVKKILNAALVFNDSIHQIIGNGLTAQEREIKYGISKAKFNTDYDVLMNEFIEMIYSQLYGKWYGFKV